MSSAGHARVRTGSAGPVVVSYATDSDARDLASFGYRQQLRRSLGAYASFAAGFSFVSILTTIFQLFSFGYSFGGPAFFWTWPLVFIGQLLVALTFAELASHYPIAGCIYQWSRRISTGLIGWFAGWMMLIGQIISVSAAAIALQVVLPKIWIGFQLVGTDTDVTTHDGATNAVILGAILIAITTIVNIIGIRVMSVINMIGVTCELVGVTLFAILMFTHAHRGPSVVMHTGGVQGNGSYVYPFLVSALMAAYVMYGFDSAGELSEETKKPRKVASRAIVRALVVSGIGGALLLIAALMAAPSLTDKSASGRSLATDGMTYVVLDGLGTGIGRALLVDVAIAVTVCTLSIQTASTRLIFSKSRDGVLPLSRLLGRVSPRTGTPIVPSLLVGVVAILVLFVNVGQTQLFTALSATAVVVVYLAYLMVTVPLLVRRLRGLPIGVDILGGGESFMPGPVAVIVNLGAVLYGAFMTVNIAWPRQSVFDPAMQHWYLQYFAPLFVGLALLVGVVAYWWRGREQAATRVLARSDAFVRPDDLDLGY